MCRFKTNEILVDLYPVTFENDEGKQQTDYIVEVVKPYNAPEKPWDGDWLHTGSAGFDTLEEASTWAAAQIMDHYKI